MNIKKQKFIWKTKTRKIMHCCFWLQILFWSLRVQPNHDHLLMIMTIPGMKSIRTELQGNCKYWHHTRNSYLNFSATVYGEIRNVDGWFLASTTHTNCQKQVRVLRRGWKAVNKVTDVHISDLSRRLLTYAVGMRRRRQFKRRWKDLFVPNCLYQPDSLAVPGYGRELR